MDEDIVYVCVIKDLKTVFNCKSVNVAMDGHSSIENLQLEKRVDQSLPIEFEDLTANALCIYASSNLNTIDTYTKNFQTKTKYNLRKLPFNYTNCIIDYFVNAIKLQTIEIDKANKQICNLKKSIEDLKRESKFSDPFLATFDITLEQDPLTNSPTVFRASKQLVLKNQASKRRKDAERTLAIPDFLTFEIGYNEISYAIEQGKLDRIVQICREKLYEEKTYDFLTFQKKPSKNEELLEYFPLNECVGEMYTRIFDMIIDMAAHLINTRIIDKSYPFGSEDIFISRKSFESIKVKQMGSCNTFRQDKRVYLFHSGQAKTITQREAEERSTASDSNIESEQTNQEIDSSSLENTDLNDDMSFDGF